MTFPIRGLDKAALTAVALAAQLAIVPQAHAQSNEELRKMVAELKARVEQLEAKSKAADEAPPPVDPEEFNRIKIKAEALEDQKEAAGFKGLKISGYMDPSYIYNRDQNRAGFQFLNRVSDDGYNYDNSYFGTAAIDFQKEMDGGTKWRLTLMPNRGAGSIADSTGNSIVHEASVSVPLGDLQTRLIAGQIPDWSGYETVQPNTSKLVTKGMLLDFTEPTAYTAAGMEVIRGNWDVKAVLGNYNQTKQAQNRKSPVFAYRVDYAKGEFSGFGFAGVHGKAVNFTQNVTTLGAAQLLQAVDPVSGQPLYNPDGTPTWGSVLPGASSVVQQPNSRLDLFEADGYFIRGDLTLQGQISLGRQKNASITPAADGSLRDAKWWGVSGLVAYKFIPRWEATARLDYINNSSNGGGLLQYSSADGRNGIGPGMVLNADGTVSSPNPDQGANRYALSVGVSYMLTSNTLIKTEYRYDGATQPVFLNAKDGTYGKSNQLLGASVVLSF